MNTTRLAKMLRAAPIAALPFILPAATQAYTFTTLYHFTAKTDGNEPIGGVVQDAAGTLYGETSQGGGVPCSSAPHGNGCLHRI